MERNKQTPRDPARAAVNRQIEENLRKVYSETLTEELPDRFTSLLAQLRATDGKKGATGNE